MPFSSVEERAIHFKKHGSGVGAVTELQYEQMADAFMTSALTLVMRECTRPNGTDRVRMNIANRHLGVAIVISGVLKTYYVVALHSIRGHGNGSVTAYFNYECTRTDL